MDDIISLAKERADLFGVRNVVIASIGEGAELVCDAFGTKDYLVIAIGNTSSARARGRTDDDMDEIKDIQQRRRKLEGRGAKVLLRDQSLFQAMAHGAKSFKIGEKRHNFSGGYFGAVTLNDVMERVGKEDAYGAVQLVYRTLNGLFGDGPRMCIEMMLMAADSDLLPLDADCIAIDRPMDESNCPHAAMILRPARTDDFFKYTMRVKDLVFVPGPRDHWFSSGPLWTG
jgi:hypothetical protein